jgi:hypothetical protein
MNVRFCPSCRCLILSDFRFCPYCGRAIKGPDLSESLDSPFAKMDEAVGNGSGGLSNRGPDVFADATESLDRLEADMDLLLAEMGKEHPSSS